jgi:hypothetical protein
MMVPIMDEIPDDEFLSPESLSAAMRRYVMFLTYSVHINTPTNLAPSITPS